MLGAMDQLLARQHHPPAREIADRGFANPIAKSLRKGRTRHADMLRQILQGPGKGGIGMHGRDRAPHLVIGERGKPSDVAGKAILKVKTQRLDENHARELLRDRRRSRPPYPMPKPERQLATAFFSVCSGV